jgi:hypothetical protein
MLRAIVAVVVGYVVMFALVFASLTAAYLGMGADRAFKSGSYEVSGLWMVVSFVLSFLAAVGGGFVCGWIARRRTPVMVLAGLVLVLGLAMTAVGALAPTEGRPTTRSGDVSNMDAMKDARTPTWICLLNPLIGAAGVLLGGRPKV